MTDDNTRDRTGGGAETAGQPSTKRSNEPLVLALIGLAVAALLFVASALPVILSRGDDSSDAQTPVSAITVAPVDTAAPANEPDAPDSDAVAVSTGAGTAATGDSAGDSIPDTTDAGATADATSTTNVDDDDSPATDEVPESKAVVLDGKIYLEGAVPNEEARAEIVDLAAEILGPDNVIDNYIIDSRAGDPNLGNIRVDDAVLFDTSSAVIAPEFEPLLNQGLALLTIRPAAKFVFVGHTDSRGSDDFNLRLSQRRAEALVRWYTDRGIDSSRLTALGLGETEPIASDDTPEGRQMNRRIEVTIENLLSEPG